MQYASKGNRTLNKGNSFSNVISQCEYRGPNFFPNINNRNGVAHMSEIYLIP